MTRVICFWCLGDKPDGCICKVPLWRKVWQATMARLGRFLNA